MTRRRLFLLSMLIAMGAVAGYFGWDCYQSILAEQHATRMRSCLEVPVNDRAPGQPVIQGIRVDVDLDLFGLDTTSDRVQLFGANDGAVCGVVKDAPLLRSLVRALPNAQKISSPRAIARSGSVAVITCGQTVTVADPKTDEPRDVLAGLTFLVTPTVQKDGCIDVHVTFALSTIDDPLNPTTAEGRIVLREGETGFLVGPKGKSSRTRELPFLRDLPWIGSNLGVSRRVEIEEEPVLLFTPKRVPS